MVRLEERLIQKRLIGGACSVDTRYPIGP